MKQKSLPNMTSIPLKQEVSISTTHDFQDIHPFTFGAGPLPKKCDKLSPFMKLLMTKRALPCQISWDQVVKPESSGVLQVLLPGRLTWNLQITHLEKKMICQTSMIMFQPLIFMGVQDRFLLLMVQKSGGNAPVEGKVVYLLVFMTCFFTSQVVLAGFLNRQQ